VVTAADYTKRANGDFDFKDFITNPENYSSVFHEKIAPYTSVIVNGIYWDARFPRILTAAQIAQLQSENKLRLVSISDISCDINGSLEFMDRASTIDQPFFFYDPANKSVHFK
jgi:alpha-aminoadipic semialdehyde synthase